MRRLAWVAAPLLLLAACGEPARKPAGTDSDASPARLIPNSPNTPTVRPQCDAPSLAYLVGKPKTQIPVPVEPARRRVSCSTCPIADDYRPDRTDIIFDTKTGVVLSVTCG